MVQWKRGIDNEPVTVEVASEAQLLIASVTDDDFGNYTCMAFNSKGSTFVTMKLGRYNMYSFHFFSIIKWVH